MSNQGNDIPEGFKLTELGLLPQEWEVVKLCDVVTFTSKPRGLDISNCTAVPFIPMEAISSDGSGHFRYNIKPGRDISSGVYCERGDLLLAKITPCLENGKQCLLSMDDLSNSFAYTTTEVYPLRADQNVTDSLFLFYYLLYPPARRELAAKMEGTTGRQRLPKHVVRNMMLPLPPLPEQKAIAGVLSTIQKAVEAQGKIISAARELKKSLMRHLFTYGLVPVAEAEKVPLKETEIGPVPEHWDVVRLGEMIGKPEYGYTASASNERVGPKFLRITDIQNGGVAWTSVPYCQCTPTETEKYKLLSGDILIARIGATTGKTLLVEECPPAIFASYLIRVRCKSSLLPAYLSQFTITQNYWNQINASKGGRLKQGVNIPVLKSLLISLPSLAEQQEITHTLSAVDDKIEAEEKRKAALQALFKTTLHLLMTGKVRVKEWEAQVS